MQRLVQIVIRTFIWIFAATALLTLGGIAFTWFNAGSITSLPYLGTLVWGLLLEIVGVVLLIAREGLKYLPRVVHNKSAADTSKFMADFVSQGTSITIVSNRVGWLLGDHVAKQAIENRARGGAKIEIITSQRVEQPVRVPLLAA